MREYRINGVHVKLNFLIILSLFLISACGGGKSTVKLEVTRSFSSSNSTFDGGLYIVGKNATNGDEFAVSLTTESSTSLNLNYGNWDISAVGWDNDPDLFEGDVLCGSTSIDFKSAEASAPISVSSGNCKNPKLLKVLTCGALFDPSNPSQLISSNNLTDSFCLDSNYHPTYFENRAQSIKISLLSRLPGQAPTASLISGCLNPSQTAGLPFVTNKKMTEDTPFVISYYGDMNCSDLQGKYDFKVGTKSYAISTHDFEAVLKENNTTLSIALASPLSKKGRTPFTTEIPKFNCNTADKKCVELPPLPSVASYIVSNYGNRIFYETTYNCDEIEFNSTATTNTYCEAISGTPFKLLEFEVLTNSITATQFNLFNHGGTQIKAILKSKDLDVYREIARLIGLRTVKDDISQSIFQGEEDMGGKNFDALSEPADILSPAKIGGLFWDQTCSQTSLGSAVKRNISFTEHGSEKSYQIILTNPPSTLEVPKYTRYTTNPWSETTTLKYDRRIILRSFLSPSGYKTEFVLDIVCDGTQTIGADNLKIGRLENFREEEFNSQLNKRRSILHWNTSSMATSRLEIYSLEESGYTTQGTFFPLSKRSYFGRAENKLENSVLDTKINSMGYDYYQSNQGNYSQSKESLRSNEINISGTNITAFDTGHIGKQGQFQAGSVFSDEFKVKEKNKINYNIDHLGNDVKIANGKMLSVKKTTSGISIQHFNGTSYNSYILGSGLFDFDMSPDGSKAVILTYTQTGGPTYTINAYFYDSTNGGSWNFQSPSTTTISMPPLSLKVRVQNSGETFIAARTQNYLYSGISNSLSIPNTLSILMGGMTSSGVSSVTKTINGIDVVKSGGDFWLFVVENESTVYTQVAGQPTTTSTNIPRVQFCKMNSSTNTNCATVTEVESIPADLSGMINNNLSLYSPATGEIYLTYHKSFPGSNWTEVRRKYFMQNGTLTYSEESLQNSMPSPDSINPYNMTTTSIMTAGSTTVNPVFIFKKPAEPNFGMKFMDLNPTHMESQIFTNKSTFEAIGNGL
jgi:hypothetical protein